MATPMEYINENDLAWQPSLNADLSGGLHGYRGALIVEPGKQISADRKLPPKIQARQVVMVSEGDKIKMIGCELESFNDFAPFYEKFKEFFVADGLNLLFVTDLEGTGSYEYDGVKFTAYPLDESSVWNELLELAELEKGDVKKLSSEEKVETMFEELTDNFEEEASKTYEEMCALKGESAKQLMGAV